MFLHTPKQKPIQPQDSTPKYNILSPAQLLHHEKRQQWITRIKKTNHLNDQIYTTLCLPLFEQLAAHCQELPDIAFYFSATGGLLDHALSRTAIATELLRQYLLPPPDSDLSEEQHRWWYVVFSAALLRNIGRLCTEYRIGRYHRNGTLIKYWEPLLEMIGHLNHQYDYTFLHSNDRTFTHRVTLLLAQKLMPTEGLSWIVTHKSLFSIWLALLQETEEDAKPLDAILDRAEELVIQEQLTSLDITEPFTPPKTHYTNPSFIDKTNSIATSTAPDAALIFFKWLMQQIERGHFLLNQSPIFSVAGGILIAPEAFQLFSKEYPSFKNWQAVRRQFLELKLHRTDHSEQLILPGTLAIPGHGMDPIEKKFGQSALRITADGESLYTESTIAKPSPLKRAP